MTKQAVNDLMICVCRCTREGALRAWESGSVVRLGAVMGDDPLDRTVLLASSIAFPVT